MELTIQWMGGMELQTTGAAGATLVMDAKPEGGGQGRGVTPLEAIIAGLGGCTAMDVLSILDKKRQTVTAYRVEVSGERAPEGEYPRPFVRFKVKHVLTGPDLDPVAVERAIELSDTKYCAVAATLRTQPQIETEFAIED